MWKNVEAVLTARWLGLRGGRQAGTASASSGAVDFELRHVDGGDGVWGLFAGKVGTPDQH